MRKILPEFTDEQSKLASTGLFNHEIDVEQIDALTGMQYAKNSVLSMKNDWNRFVRFCQLKQSSSLPCEHDILRQFIEKEAQDRKFASVRRCILTIALIHKAHQFPDPTSDRQVLHTLSQLQLTKHGDAKQATALTQAHLDALNRLLKPSKALKDIRDLAIYYLMYEALLKRSHLKRLQVQDIIEDMHYPYLKLSFEDHIYPLSQDATNALNAWLMHRSKHDEFLFCGMDRHQNLNQNPLDDSSIYRILRSASDLLGLRVQFSGQSTRVGRAQALYQEGMKVRDVQHMGRWLSPAMPAQYVGQLGLAKKEMLKFKTFKPLT